MRSISLFLRSVTKSLILFTTLTFTGVYVSHAQSAAEGATLFKQKCTSCHALDKKVVGPALKGVSDRHKEDWLVKWINNAPSMIASGDKEAVAIANEYKPMVMTAFPELTPDNVKGILAYIKAEETKPAAAPVAGPVSGDGSQSASNGEVSNFELGGVIAIAVIALLVIFVLNRVIKSLERVALQKQGVVLEEEVASGPAFRKLLKNKKFIFFIVLVLVIFLGSAGWKGMWETGVHQGYQPVQPIKFSHQLHAGINKIDCQYCHTGAYKSKNASIPSLNVCMNCHNYVQATEKYNGEISPEIQKIYKALDYNPDTKVYGPNKKPVEWIRIHNLQDFAYFNHSQHVKVAGIQCQKCHGPIQTMSEVYQYSPLTMKWCINCHKETEVNHKGNAYYDRLIAAHSKLKKGEKPTAAVMGGLECGKCHY
ncbi:MAG: cytochrome c class [Sphingobacteriales bacterium]|nr:cytochrome c class [Sphingobacteriales bacterium]